MADIKYKLVYSRRRTVSIIVSPVNGVTVRAPYRTSLKSIEKYVGEKSHWILKHIDKQSGLIRLNEDKEYTGGESFLYLGRKIFLKIAGSAKSFVRTDGENLEAGSPHPEDRAKIRSMIIKWYLAEAKSMIRAEATALLEKYKNYNFYPSLFVVKKLKSRWGSCSSKGVITISSELIKLDPKFTRYVITHELCHLKHHNHGKEFYLLLAELLPDYKSIRKELRRYITEQTVPSVV